MPLQQERQVWEKLEGIGNLLVNSALDKLSRMSIQEGQVLEGPQLEWDHHPCLLPIGLMAAEVGWVLLGCTAFPLCPFSWRAAGPGADDFTSGEGFNPAHISTTVSNQSWSALTIPT